MTHSCQADISERDGIATAIDELVIAWEYMARSALVSPLLVPTLETINGSLQGLLNRDILLHTQWTMGRVAIGFGCAVVAGVALGSALAISTQPWI